MKDVPTFGTAAQYMRVLWRMDAVYAGARSTLSGECESRRSHMIRRSAQLAEAQIKSATDVQESGLHFSEQTLDV